MDSIATVLEFRAPSLPAAAEFPSAIGHELDEVQDRALQDYAKQHAAYEQACPKFVSAVGRFGNDTGSLREIHDNLQAVDASWQQSAGEVNNLRGSRTAVSGYFRQTNHVAPPGAE